jgi:hypothetical protein
MLGGDIAAIDCEPESSRTNAEQSGGISQVHPSSWLVWLIASDAMMAAQRGDSLPCPAIPVPCQLTIAVQDPCYEVIAADTSQNLNTFYQLTRCLRAALATTPARQAQFGVGTAFPVQREDKFASRTIHIDEDFLDQCSDDAFLQAHTCG